MTISSYRSTNFFLVGWIRDATGSYVSFFMVVGACGVIGSSLFLVEPLVSRLTRKSYMGQSVVKD